MIERAEGRVLLVAGHRVYPVDPPEVDERLRRLDAVTPEDVQRANPKQVSEAYQQHILNGILWALRLADGEATPLPDSAYDR